MCVVSMIMDHYHDKWTNPPIKMPEYVPYPMPYPMPYPVPNTQPMITKEEVEEFRKLLERAREYDRRNNEPDCELEEKKKKVKELAKSLGVEISFL